MTTANDLLRRALEELIDQDNDLRSEFETWDSPPIIEEIRAYLDTQMKLMTEEE